jgi:hypothetical protein
MDSMIVFHILLTSLLTHLASALGYKKARQSFSYSLVNNESSSYPQQCITPLSQRSCTRLPLSCTDSWSLHVLVATCQTTRSP